MNSHPTDSITTERLFVNRRKWIKAATLVASLPISAGLYCLVNPIDDGSELQPELPNLAAAKLSRSELRENGFISDQSPSSFYNITHLNNFYEFTTDQQLVWDQAKDFYTNSWSVEVSGLVERPAVFSLVDLEQRFSAEQRVYRMRCVEGWSMVIPWAGFSLAALLEHVRPTPQAKYVAFETLLDRARFPNQRPGELQWPYTEGLRLDEALHPLTILATGLYGRRLPPQNGAPIRLVVPWKYGFKSIKSIVRIALLDHQPITTWSVCQLLSQLDHVDYANPVRLSPMPNGLSCSTAVCRW